MNFYTKLINSISELYQKVKASAVVYSLQFIQSFVNIFNKMKSISKATYFFYSLIALSILFFVELLLIESYVKKVQKSQIEIFESLDNLDQQVKDAKVLILEGEVERLRVKSDVIQNDAAYQLRMNAYRERIDELKKRYNDKTDYFGFE
jgi:uncharacterized protein Yka (UPF0111/DUF47 family)